MDALRHVGDRPVLDKPVLITMLSGWIDASGAANAAIDALKKATNATLLATFDADTFIDYRARRPIMELREGLNSRLRWSVPELHHGTDANGRDIVILSGPEPDTAWELFVETVCGFCADNGVERAFAIGAYPFATPHTRPPQLSCHSPSPHVLAEVPFLKNSADVPAGMSAVLEHGLTEHGISALSLWAQVPHYVAAMSYPAAAAALVSAVQMVAGLVVDVSDLVSEAQQQRERIDQLVSANPEHLEMVRQLERMFDDAVKTGQVDARGETPASGDAIAAEIERFLREEMGRDNK
ncbi:MAG: PAC2 family protein [Acidobacteria bacterium]|nr:PAC2 family protein [Acidobacteriota bacterium]